jgi:hypothetical protein
MTAPKLVPPVVPSPALNRTPSQLRQDLRACTLDGMLYMLMVGLGQEYFAKFARDLGMGDAAVGWIEPIAMLLATLVQQFSVYLVLIAGSYRRVVWIAAALQGLSLLPLAALAWWSADAPNLGTPASPVLTVGLYALISVFFISAFAGGPPWMAMLGLTFPQRVLRRYLGRRTVLLHAALLLGLLGGGLALHQATLEGQGAVMRVLAVMFVLAAIARLGSAYYLSRYSQDGFEPPVIVPPTEVLRRARTGNDGKALTYLIASQAAMWIAFPFFRPYMLSQLGTPAADQAGDQAFLYSSLLAAFFVGKLVAPEVAGRAIQRFGLYRVAWVTAIALVPVPLLWLLSSNPWWLLAFQFIGGAALASFELCSVLFQMEHVPVRERASVLSTFGLGVYAAGFAGSTVGVLILGESATADRYAWLFAASAAARMLTLPLLRRLRHESVPVG